jgi:hypothetical protein
MARSTLIGRLANSGAADEAKADWAIRLAAIGAIQACEASRAAADADVAAFRRQMPNGTAFADQTMAARWLANLGRENRLISSPPPEPEYLSKFLKLLKVEDPVFGLRITPLLDERGLRPLTAIWFDLRMGDPDHEEQPGDIDDDGEWTIPMGPFSVVVARPYGLLAELLYLGVQLERRYGWTPSSARSWVVCSAVVPTVHAIKVDQVSGENGKPIRFRFDVDAGLPPQILLARLQELQEQHDLRSTAKPRSLLPRNARATVFSVRNNDGSSWAEVWKRFNAEYPEYAFENSGEFANRVRETYKSLMGENLNWNRRSGT